VSALALALLAPLLASEPVAPVAPVAPAEPVAPVELARVSSIALPEGWECEEVLIVDLSGDDVADVCLALAKGDERRIALHLRRAEGAPFAAAPDALLDLTPDALAFAAADVGPDPGRELLLFGARGVFVWRWRATDEAQRFARLAECDLLWQLAAEGTLFHLQAAVEDLDGDGREDLALPEPRGVRVLLQRGPAERPALELAAVLAFPDDDLSAAGPGGVALSSPSGRRRVELRVGGGAWEVAEESGAVRPYLQLADTAPAAQLADWDGDGDLDVLALTDAHLHVALQEPRGRFDAANVLRLAAPVPRDRSRELDVSFQARGADLDGDRRSDVLYFAQDKRSDDVRTQALVFLQAAVPAGEPVLFGARGVPRQLLVLDGFARPLGVEDVDGDGLGDLIAAALRPDLIDALRAAASQRLDAELYVYRSRGATGFSPKPDLVRVISVLASAGGRGDTFLAGFHGDVTGDGVRELFERSEPDRLRVFLVRRARDGTLSIAERPLWEMAIEPEARLVFPGRISARMPDVFALEEGRVLCASFR
jgi:hypothetical protein